MCYVMLRSLICLLASVIRLKKENKNIKRNCVINNNINNSNNDNNSNNEKLKIEIEAYEQSQIPDNANFVFTLPSMVLRAR